MIVDLHCHTNSSDGVLSADEIITKAEENNIEMLSITDHDTLAAYKLITRETNIKLITGIEVSSEWAGIGVHIVGLNIDLENKQLNSLIKNQQQAREDRLNIIVLKLNKANIDIKVSDIKKIANSSIIGRPHIAKHLVDTGVVNSFDRAFKKYLGNGSIGDVKSLWAKPEEVISAIKSAGGVAIIAHPDKYKMTRTKSGYFFDELCEYGLDAIEVISGNQHQDITTKFSRMANDRNLYASIGSDFHREDKYMSDLGKTKPLPDDVNPVWDLFC